MTTMKTPPTISKTETVAPTPLLELCDAATQGPYATDYDGVYVVRKGPGIKKTVIACCSYPQFHVGDTRANAQLIARLSPEVVKAVYEALDAIVGAYKAGHAAQMIAKRNYSSDFTRCAELAIDAQRLLDGLPQQHQAI